jgi:hypothetical protein
MCPLSSAQAKISIFIISGKKPNIAVSTKFLTGKSGISDVANCSVNPIC